MSLIITKKVCLGVSASCNKYLMSDDVSNVAIPTPPNCEKDNFAGKQVCFGS